MACLNKFLKKSLLNFNHTNLSFTDPVMNATLQRLESKTAETPQPYLCAFIQLTYTYKFKEARAMTN